MAKFAVNLSFFPRHGRGGFQALADNLRRGLFGQWEAAMRAEVRELYNITVAHMPAMPDVDFRTVYESGNVTIICYFPRQWSLLDTGTEGPYSIVAKNARFLAFFVPYKRGTIPGRYFTNPPSWGDELVFRRRVVSPGFKGTGWVRLMEKDLADEGQVRAQALLDSVL